MTVLRKIVSFGTFKRTKCFDAHFGFDLILVAVVGSYDHA